MADSSHRWYTGAHSVTRERASDSDVYATPSEHIRDLIRQDMQDRALALHVLEGLQDLRHGRFSAQSILDIKEEN